MRTQHKALRALCETSQHRRELHSWILTLVELLVTSRICQTAHTGGSILMYVIIKYGDNQSLICNPVCSVVNLLDSIKGRIGHTGKKTDINLSDETGQLQDLEIHSQECADKFLNSQNTYILLEKQISDTSNGIQQQFVYTPLLSNYSELYPDFKLRLSEAQKRKLNKPLRNVIKSPSPAGQMGTKCSASKATGRESLKKPHSSKGTK